MSTHPTLSVSGVSTYPTLSISDVLATPTLSVSGVSATPSLSVSGVSALPTRSMSGLYPPAVTYPVPLSVPLSTGVLTPTPYHFPGVPSSCGTVVSHYSLPPVPTTVPHPSMHAVVPQVKLPKLSIRKFSGDLTKWVTFWDSFNSAIHSNPSLSSVDKFNYLRSLVELSAAEAIAGLTITSANYDEAIATLKKRFGNPQLIVNRHMEALLGVTAVSSHLDIKGLRKLHDTVEAHVRGLRALGVPAESYGGLLTSVLVNKLPSELRLIVSREITTGRWDLDGVMKILEREVEARERASTTGVSGAPRKTQPRTPTGAALLTSNSASRNGGPVVCIVDKVTHPLHVTPLLMSLHERKSCVRLGGATSAYGGTISAEIVARPPAADYVEGGTMSPSVPARTWTKEGRPPAHKLQEVHPPLRTPLKLALLPTPCMSVHRLPFFYRQRGCGCSTLPPQHHASRPEPSWIVGVSRPM